MVITIVDQFVSYMCTYITASSYVVVRRVDRTRNTKDRDACPGADFAFLAPEDAAVRRMDKRDYKGRILRRYLRVRRGQIDKTGQSLILLVSRFKVQRLNQARSRIELKKKDWVERYGVWTIF